jgi:hypothetical protein
MWLEAAATAFRMLPFDCYRHRSKSPAKKMLHCGAKLRRYS